MAKHSTPRGLRDEANVGPDPRSARHLIPLKELGKVKVADGEPDIRGWTAYTSSGREIGRVDELLVDRDAGEVVMLDVDLRRDDRHTLIPLRAVWVDHATRRVVADVRALGDDEVPSLARSGQLSDDEVQRFDEGYGRAYGQYADEREVRVRRADEELRFGRGHDRDADGVDDRAERAERAAAAVTPSPSAADRRRFVERHRAEELERYSAADAADEERQVRLPRRTEPFDGDETVVERRPMVEEVVVRRRAAGDDDLDADRQP